MVPRGETCPSKGMMLEYANGFLKCIEITHELTLVIFKSIREKIEGQ